MTSLPGPLSTGRLSPVTIASLTAEAPSTTSPSTGIFSPGRTRTRSPTAISLTGTTASAPSRMTVASRGARRSRARTASEVCPRARASRKRPRVMSVRIMAAES